MIEETLRLHKLYLNNEEGGVRANLEGANLKGADLRRVYLRRAYLRGADLTGSDLRGANLRLANLKKADLEGANLEGAYLRGADLEGANLTDANLEAANLEGAIKIPIHCKWSHGITDDKIQIGCEIRSIEDWDKFFESDEVIETPRDTYEFLQIKAVYNAYKAYLTTLKQ